VTPKNDEKTLEARLRATTEDANNSRSGSRKALQQLIGEVPAFGALVVETYGDAARRAETSLVRHVSGGNVLVDESTRIWLTDKQRDLLESDDTELERLLVHRTALCWLEVNTAEHLRAEKWKGGIDSETAAFWDRHVSRVQGDFLKACRTLATVRKLRRPVIQVNIADKQINVVSSAS